MNFMLIFLFAMLAIASVSAAPGPRRIRIIRRRPFRLFRGDDEYAASLGGADVGSYRRQQRTRHGRFGTYRDTEVSGLSLGKAKVGLYSRERDGRVPLFG
ncbi:hypothetical protein NPIL_635111 [Nephila pilipes]|uniref:Uncharacterized protein n=1 Tax=Nephila pilipes TaxID=299642 RepID=A0A8X6R1B0_NEPPI|nr:hypothetical protein NPIL_635111 [Nephila pilipes]